MSLFNRKKQHKKSNYVTLERLSPSSDFVIAKQDGRIYHKYTDSRIRGSNKYAVYETKDIRNVRYLPGNTLVKKV
ncbi:MAG: hypothetical protein J1F32_01855 [Erysipelotrichales bacterium]|nr:hypothetical protein [Erysipelotrichales bacterium]